MRWRGEDGEKRKGLEMQRLVVFHSQVIRRRRCIRRGRQNLQLRQMI